MLAIIFFSILPPSNSEINFFNLQVLIRLLSFSVGVNKIVFK